MSGCLQAFNDHFNSLPVWAKALAGTAAAAVSSYVLWSFNRQRKSPYKTDFVPNVVYLYQLGRSQHVPSMSPYCLKLETWLRMAELKYENVDIPLSIRSKEGTLPFVELNGKEYCDSGFAIRDLTRLLNREGMEENLANEQKAVARSFEQMVENSTLWSIARVAYMEKWSDLCSGKIVAPEIACYFKIPFVRWMIQSKLNNRLKAHGIGKHDNTEIDGIGIDDLKAVSNYLGVKRFFLGEQPHRIDAALFGVLAQVVYFPVETVHRQFIEKECQNLIKFCDRMKDKFWPDWAEICEKLTLNTSYNLK